MSQLRGQRKNSLRKKSRNNPCPCHGSFQSLFVERRLVGDPWNCVFTVIPTGAESPGLVPIYIELATYLGSLFFLLLPIGEPSLFGVGFMKESSPICPVLTARMDYPVKRSVVHTHNSAGTTRCVNLLQGRDGEEIIMYIGMLWWIV